MAEITDQKSSKRSPPQRRVASATNQSNQTSETPKLKRPSLPAHPHSEPTAPATHKSSDLSAEDMMVSKGSNSKKRKTSSVDAFAPSMRSSPFIDSSLTGKIPTTDDSATPETPCPPRPKAGRSNAVGGTGRTRSGQNSTSSRRISRAQGLQNPFLQNPFSGGTKSVAIGSLSCPSSPEGVLDSEEEESDTVSDTSSLSEEELTNDVLSSVTFGKMHEEPLPRRVIAQKVFDAICNKALKVKEAKRGEEGFIYILEDPRWPDYVKIGRTSKNPEKRNHQIRRCGMPNLKPVIGQHYTSISCYERLELIIHADLWNERHHYPCLCGKSDTTPKDTTSNTSSPKVTKHREWFKIDKEEAMHRVEQWREWMRREPYDIHGILKSDWQKRIKSLVKDKSYEETVEAEQSSRKWWQSFMEPFPDPPPWIVRETIEARVDDQDVQWPSRVDCILDKKKDVVCFLVAFLLFSCFLLDLVAYLFPGMLFRALSYLILACTSFCWL